MQVKERDSMAAFAAGRLPEELAEFLRRDTYSLVIKGGSGTGKSLLALTILRSLLPLENVLYISTRTSPLQLFEYYPWIEDIFGPPTGPNGEEGEGWENLVDSRLDEPNAVFERVTNVLMDEQAPIVVIDSWEALADSLGTEALRTNLRVLEAWRERAGARFIFIGEDPGNNTIDYMVEGLVVLKDKTEEGRRVREILLSKLHGVQIKKPTYFFTLDGGRFRCFPRHLEVDFEFKRPLKVKMDRPLKKTKGRIPTGYPVLDDVLKGGFPQKSPATIELEGGVDPKVALVLLEKTFQDWAASGGTVLLQRPQGVPQSYITQFSKSFIAEKHRKSFRSFDSNESTLRHGEESGTKKTIVLLWQSQGRGVEVSQDRVGELASKVDLLIVLAREIPPASPLAEAPTRLKLTDMEGTLFVKGESPWTPLLGVVPGSTAGNPMIQLESVV